MRSDVEYFELRGEEERQAARESPDAKARELHLELARRYEQLGAALADDEKNARARDHASTNQSRQR